MYQSAIAHHPLLFLHALCWHCLKNRSIGKADLALLCQLIQMQQRTVIHRSLSLNPQQPEYHRRLDSPRLLHLPKLLSSHNVWSVTVLHCWNHRQGSIKTCTSAASNWCPLFVKWCALITMIFAFEKGGWLCIYIWHFGGCAFLRNGEGCYTTNQSAHPSIHPFTRLALICIENLTNLVRIHKYELDWRCVFPNGIGKIIDSKGATEKTHTHTHEAVHGSGAAVALLWWMVVVELVTLQVELDLK